MKTFRVTYIDTAGATQPSIDYEVADFLFKGRDEAVVRFHAEHPGCTILHLVEMSDPAALAETGIHPDA